MQPLQLAPDNRAAERRQMNRFLQHNYDKRDKLVKLPLRVGLTRPW